MDSLEFQLSTSNWDNYNITSKNKKNKSTLAHQKSTDQSLTTFEPHICLNQHLLNPRTIELPARRIFKKTWCNDTNFIHSFWICLYKTYCPKGFKNRSERHQDKEITHSWDFTQEGLFLIYTQISKSLKCNLTHLWLQIPQAQTVNYRNYMHQARPISWVLDERHVTAKYQQTNQQTITIFIIEVPCINPFTFSFMTNLLGMKNSHINMQILWGWRWRWHNSVIRWGCKLS